MPPSSCVAMSRRIDAVSAVEGGRGFDAASLVNLRETRRQSAFVLFESWPVLPQSAKSCSKNIHSLGESWQTTVAPFNLACSWEFAASGVCSLGQGLLAALFTCYLTFDSYLRRALPLPYMDGLGAPFNPFVALSRYVIAEI